MAKRYKAAKAQAANQALAAVFAEAQRAQQAGRLEQAEAGYRRILREQPERPEALHFLGLVDYQRGRHGEAVRRMRRSVKLAPSDAAFWNNFGLALRAAGALEESEAAHRRALALRPGFVAAAFNLALALEALGRLDAAQAAYQQTLSLQPGHPKALVNLGALLAAQGHRNAARRLLLQAGTELAGMPPFDRGRVLLEAGLSEAAEAAFRQCLEQDPAALRPRAALARALHALGRCDEALAELEALVQSHPEEAEPWLERGRILRASDPEAAAEAFEQALAREADRVEAVCGLLMVRKVRPEDRPRVEQWRALPTTLPEQDWLRAELELALAKAFDDLGAFEAAFSHCQAGNAIRRRFARYDPAREAQRVADMAATFTPGLIQALGRAGHPSAQPVFVVGMPRSGTTLVEQIIASHPEGAGAGELEATGELLRELPGRLATGAGFPQCCSALNSTVLHAMAEDYLTALRRAAGAGAGAARISDKMPQNFRHIGLLALMFPEARFVHCRRNLLDNAVSIYFQRLSNDHGYASDLAHIGHQQLQYLALMALWDRVLPGRVHHLDYERLVAEPEPQVRGLLAFLGLPWDARCLDFHKTRREVNTLSLWQVRQPLYASSVARWRHYESHLGPLKAALGPQRVAEAS